MTDKTTLLRAFNTHFLEFLEDISAIFPQNEDISSAKTSFEFIKRVNPSAVIKAWYKYVYEPYNEIINAGDIRFFFDKDYKDDVSILDNANEIMRIIDMLREPIRTMSEGNQEKTMKYIQNLSKLSFLYFSIRK